MTMETLGDRLKTLAALKDTKKELAAQVKENNAAIEQSETEIIAAMLDMAEAAGLDNVQDFNVAVDGRKYGVIIKPYYSIKAENRDVAFAALRQLGLGDLIVEKVDDRTLTKTLQVIAEENEGMLPEAYDILPLSAYEKTTISDRKAGR